MDYQIQRFPREGLSFGEFKSFVALILSLRLHSLQQRDRQSNPGFNWSHLDNKQISIM